MAPTARCLPAVPVLCFLCARRIDPAGMAEAHERVLADHVPAKRDFAHAGCAERAGHRDHPDDGDESPERPR